MKKSLILAMAFLAMGCTKIDYVGKEYPSTADVEIFFSMEDVQKDFEVMGHLTATADDFVSTEKMQEDILKKAREKGADAVVILELDRFSTGGSSSWSETTENKETTEGSQTTVSGTSSSSTDEKKEIRAILLKYKQE